MRKSCGGWQEEERKEGGNLQQQEGWGGREVATFSNKKDASNIKVHGG